MAKENSKLFLLVFLGMLTAFGPFVTDMYLPSLPSMTVFFHTSLSRVQLGLTASMVGLAVGQLFFGPLSDKYGRRYPLIVSMILFLIATLGCLYSGSIVQFVGWRLVQGMAGAGGIVISRSIAADKCAGRDLLKMLAIIGAINGVAPVAAPIAGGSMTDSVGWRGIFGALFVLGVLLLLGSLNFRESLPCSCRQRSSWKGVFGGFGEVIRNQRFVCYVLLYAFSQVVLFANIASAPFIMQQHYGFSPMMFSLCFGINAVSMVVASAMTVRFAHPEIAVLRGSIGMTVISLILFVAFSLDCSFLVYELLLVALLFMLGLTFTASNTLAMNCERANAGVASALLGASGFAFGGIVSPLVGLGNILTSTGAAFLIGSVCAFLCTFVALRRAYAMVRCYKQS